MAEESIRAAIEDYYKRKERQTKLAMKKTANKIAMQWIKIYRNFYKNKNLLLLQSEFFILTLKILKIKKKISRYEELNEKANQVANYLKKRGIVIRFGYGIMLLFGTGSAKQLFGYE